MKKMALMLAAAFLTAAATAQQPAPQVQPYENFIRVTGESERTVVPNEIYLSIVIDQNAAKGKTDVNEVERKMVAALRRIGIDPEKQLQVGDLSGDLKTYTLRRDRMQTTKTYSLKLGSAKQLGEAYAALSDLGITDMNVTKATRSDLQSIKMEMRTEAMKNAQAIAETLAEAVGQKSGRAIYIQDNNYFYNEGPILMRTANFAAKAESDSAAGTQQPDLQFQDMKLTYSVQVKFLLE